ncbi:MAG: hypothetical protein MK291_00155 [Planctomycetes bacterium]|nr:hypothetical protein [Planctomycetota bacterium]
MSVALVAILSLLATPPGLAFLRGIGGVPPAPAARDQEANRRSGDLPPISTVRGGES